MNTTAQAVFITAKFAFILTSFSAVQRYDFPIFTVVNSSLHGFILIQHNDQSPAGMLAQLVEHCTGIAEGHGFKSLIGLNFFTTVQEVFTTAKIAFTFTSLSVVQIYALTLVIIAYWCLACIKDLEVAAFWVS